MPKIYDIGDVVKLDEINYQSRIGIILEKKYDNSFIYIAPYYGYKVLIQGIKEPVWISEDMIREKL